MPNRYSIKTIVSNQINFDESNSLANVTGLKTAQMAGYLTATMAQFNIVAEDSVSVVNKINEVSLVAS